MLKVNNLSYAFPQKDLYTNISFTLEEGQHCAFIGISGSGKSTLIDMIMDPEKYMFEGDLEIAPDCRIGYVSQLPDPDKTRDITVFEYIGGECLKLQNELTSICTELETSLDLEPLLEKYQETLDAFEALGGDDFESQINKKLNLAGLMAHKDLKVSELSGGEFKLIQVIKEMLNKPHLMIMDEPDGFLDFENLNALKKLINAHKGTLLVITHNRYLLNHCFNKIIHLENTQLQEFDGNYNEYHFSLLEKKIELQELAIADTEEIERNQALINKLRGIATDNADPARGKSLKARVKIQERLEARRIQEPFVAIKQPHIQLTTAHTIEECVALSVNDYSVAFDETLLENVNFEVMSTDKVALIGANGTGKTTLLREIFKNTNPSIQIHEGIEVGYLSQHQGEVLSEANTIMEEFLDAGFEIYQEIIDYLAPYGFAEEMLNQKISALSGGEKTLLQLAKLSTTNANLLLLDEPTSHLDTYSQLALEKAIENYNGAILMISHDFYSVVNCMDYALIIQEQTIRKISMRKFRKMIYASHFDKDYLEIEKKKKALEMKIELALRDQEFLLAKSLCEQLEPIIKLL
ncbi:MAG: ABC-F family ATP-binding cassette domain-containing protein [Cellulosilyticaceae bacterium]